VFISFFDSVMCVFFIVYVREISVTSFRGPIMALRAFVSLASQAFPLSVYCLLSLWFFSILLLTYLMLSI
jgi:uncharacterized membrane protein (DUF485 family)